MKIDDEMVKILKCYGFEKDPNNSHYFMKNMLDGRIEISLSAMGFVDDDANARERLYVLSIYVDRELRQSYACGETKMRTEFKEHLDKMCKALVNDLMRVAEALVGFSMTGV